MSNAIRRGEDDELERVSERERERKEKDRRQAEWRSGPLVGPSPADCETKTGGAGKE